ncbi:MAG: FRG domain-containing protein [candidate division Zixibacteria bacterium]|nr:FRG domain-containing protein [candidate division Zixibacteria bacterium]
MTKQNRWYDNIKDAIGYCIDNYSGSKYVFRGQREDWPLRSTLFRVPEDEREIKWQETLKFCQWMLNNPYLKPYHQPQDKLIAIAQHYGYPTDLLDFTKDPKIAAFFASTGNIEVGKPGVILIIDLDMFRRLCQSYKIPGLLTLEIKGLWRLENQQGIFLRDYHDFMRQIDNMGYIDLFLEKVLFKQIKGVNITTFFPEINQGFIYPEPNDLEREIMRYEDIRLRSRPIESLIDLDSFTVLHIERDPVGKDVEELLSSTLWEADELEKWSTVSQLRYIDYPRVDNNETIGIHFESTLPAISTTEDLLKPYILVIREFRRRVVNKVDLPMVKPIASNSIMQQFENVDKIVFSSNAEYEEFKKLPIIEKSTFPECAKLYFIHVLTKNIQEILMISTFLPFLELEVAKSIQTSFSLVFNCRAHNLNLYTNPRLTSPYEGEVVVLEYEDEAGVVSRCCAPSSYFDNLEEMTKIRQLFNKKYPQYALEKNSQLFQFMHDIRKIMSLREAIDLWASIIVPSEIFFRSKIDRVLNPYYVKKIGYA